MAILVLGSTFGILYLIFILASILHGVSCLQAFLYFNSARSVNDHWAFKVLVVWMLFLDTLHEASLIHAVYYYLVENWGVPDSLGCAVWYPYTLIPWPRAPHNVSGCGGYTYLIIHFPKVSGGNRVLCGTISRLGAVLNVESRSASHSRMLTGNLAWSTLGCSLAADTLCAGSLVYYLYKGRRGLDGTSTESLVNKLILYVVTTGLLPDAIVTIDLIGYVAAPRTLWFVGISTLTTTTCCNSLLSMLNVRDYLLRESSDGLGRRGPGVQTVSLSHIRFRQSTAGRDPESQREENESARDVDIESSKHEVPTSVHVLHV
ncbi:uncharacterized protein STEHIDRAFT_114555 [Stereum hirsutum FP-91666 SS1]|uniref:uncharacterized protein n=1 Tax=Stereum hirsutum (strain FP-91666) TaxID=721885 RepID=UPI0004449667|nr:uncharacterized protein STEHIDRAFT_114555 [Stereum hirsutum FP-91666 SS1]EIM81864.1 hypothetical protein STEHIDRAFT_114555 [Stereum hirsutum FP-91666 SS1]